VDYRGDANAQLLATHPDGLDAVIHLAADPTGLMRPERPGGRFVSTLLSSPEQLPAGE
jgi:hypothetical protein